MENDLARVEKKIGQRAGTAAESPEALLALAEHQWFGGIFSGEDELAVVRLLLRAYRANAAGQPIHKKAAAAALGVEDLRTARKYVDLVERHGLLTAIPDEKDKRKALLVPTERLRELVARELVLLRQSFRDKLPITESEGTGLEEGLAHSDSRPATMGKAPSTRPQAKLLERRGNVYFYAWAAMVDSEARASERELEKGRRGSKSYSKGNGAKGSELSRLIRRANQCFGKNDWKGAIGYLTRALELAPNQKWNYIKRGNIYVIARDYNRAIADFTQAIELDLDWHLGWIFRAMAQLEAGNPAKGLPDVERALELRPAFAAGFETRGRIFEALGRRDEALADVERALELGPDSWGALETRGRIFEALGRRDEAIADFRRALAMYPDLESANEALKRLDLGAE